jgi:hypothetical protein
MLFYVETFLEEIKYFKEINRIILSEARMKGVLMNRMCLQTSGTDVKKPALGGLQ